MIVLLRLRGEVGTRHDILAAFKVLGMKKMYAFKLLENTPSNMGMIIKVSNHAAWGEANDETVKLLKDRTGLKHPKGGFKSKKLRYPRGDLGHHEKINELIKRMV